jgi:hypothetical protein
MLTAMGMDERELIDVLQELGDPGTRATIGQRVRRWSSGASALPGEMIAFLTLLERVRRVTMGFQTILPRKRK